MKPTALAPDQFRLSQDYRDVRHVLAFNEFQTPTHTESRAPSTRSSSRSSEAGSNRRRCI